MATSHPSHFSGLQEMQCSESKKPEENHLDLAVDAPTYVRSRQQGSQELCYICLCAQPPDTFTPLLWLFIGITPHSVVPLRNHIKIG